MGYGFKILVEGEYALFTRPEFKVERVSYDVPPVSAMEGLIKSIYWKPAIRIVKKVDKVHCQHINPQGQNPGQKHGGAVVILGHDILHIAVLFIRIVEYGSKDAEDHHGKAVLHHTHIFVQDTGFCLRLLFLHNHRGVTVHCHRIRHFVDHIVDGKGEGCQPHQDNHADPRHLGAEHSI